MNRPARVDQRSPLRRDLRILRRHVRQRLETWIADPISGKVLRTLAPPSQRWSATFEKTTGPRTIEERQAFEDAYRLGLLQTDAERPPTPQSHWWHNPLSIRLPGFNADAIAIRLAAMTGWLFSGKAVLCWSLLLIVTLVAALTRGAEITHQLKTLPSFQADHWFFALLIIAGTKVLHELAHAAVCRRMGAPCREMGMLILCGTPCLYCDVSESWRVAAPRRRMAIMAAGIYLELIVAAVAFWIWVGADPAFTRLVALHVMFVCGVSTVMMNANPLMRYDGYFLMADLLNQANPRQLAQRCFQRLVIGSWAGGRFANLGQASNRPASIGWSLYHVLAKTYQWVVVIALSSWMYWIISNWGLEPIGRVALWSLGIAMVVREGLRGVGMMMGKGLWASVKPWQRFMAAGLIGGVAIGTLLIPINDRITATGHTEFARATAVFVPYSGTIQSIDVVPGQIVVAGERVASLQDPALEISAVQASARVDELELRYALLADRAVDSPQLNDSLPAYEQALRVAIDEQAAISEKKQRATLVAPISGMVVSPGTHANEPSNAVMEWNPQHLIGAALPAGYTLLRIADTDQKRVLLDVDADLRRHFRIAQSVRVQVEGWGQVFEAQVSDIASSTTDLAESSAERTMISKDAAASFQITCDLPIEYAAQIPEGATVRAVVRSNSRRVYEYLWSQLVSNGP